MTRKVKTRKQEKLEADASRSLQWTGAHCDIDIRLVRNSEWADVLSDMKELEEFIYTMTEPAP